MTYYLGPGKGRLLNRLEGREVVIPEEIPGPSQELNSGPSDY